MITVLGLSGAPIGQDELALLARAGLVAGGRRHLDAVRHLVTPRARLVELAGDLEPALREIEAHLGEVVVLASGDPGFFGIVRALGERVGRHALDVRPAPSSVALAFAAAGLPWDDALVVSAHGRDPAAAVAACRRHAKVAVLTQPGFGPAELAVALADLDRRIVVGERLGTRGQRVVEGTPAEIAAGTWSEPNVVLVLDEAAVIGPKALLWPPRVVAERWGLPESAFAHRDGMVTKAEVRAVALGMLGPGVGDLVWDIGAGSGSVAVECARMGAAALAVETDAEQCARIRENAGRHGVPVQVVEGRAPDALVALADPDAVFVGGGGGDLEAIVRACAERARRVVVVALATVERVGPVLDVLAGAGLDTTGTAVHAARLAPLGLGHRLDAANPVFLLEGRRQ